MNENRRNLTYVTWIVLCAIVCVVDARSADAAKPVTVIVDADASARVRFGVERLSAALRGLEPTAGRANDRPTIIVGTHERSAAVGKLIAAGSLQLPKPLPGKEGFVLRSIDERRTVVVGMDDSGTLYGCLELAERIRKAGGLPGKLDVADAPRFVLRGPCIGMQKMRITYDGMTYDYPYTPENFPFFYNKQQWQQYLDFLVSQRMNMLVLWNGHPFPSLLKLPKYPEAQEVSDEVLKRNIEVFTWLTEEADRRGIWVIQFFYNIHISHPLAKKHNIPFHHGRPTKLTSDYTRYCISEFVRSYPHVGLMVCLGEALQGHQNEIYWFTKVILPGVTDGMKQLGMTEEPPVILRAHSISSPKADVLAAGLKVYKNLYTMAKLNGESLTTWQPRGRWRKIHQDLSSLGSTHVVNVHLLSNLEPFRYGSPSFVQKCMLASRDTLGARALHLYPLSYWDWPYSPDNTQPRLKQIDRDWMWFATWARYAWNPDRDVAAERVYWTGRLAERYGSREAGEGILDAYEGTGECAPRILRRFGITGGGRQTMSLGMLMTQLVNPDRYHPWVDLWQSDSPPGERLGEYVDREWNRRPHEGETPPRIIDEILRFSEQALTAIDAAAPHVTKNRDEFERLRNDVRCIRAMTCCYAAKARAAMLVLRYGHGGELPDLEKALPLLEESLAQYRKLTALTKDTYLYSNSLQTAGRRIPLVGTDGRNSHWLDLLPVYEKELANFRGNLARLRAQRSHPSLAPDQPAVKPWPAASFKLLGEGAETYPVRPGAKVFTDRDYAIRNLAGELAGLTGVRFSHGAAKRERMKVDFEVSEPVKVLVGYFDDRRKTWLQVPDLEVQAAADDRGGYDPVLRDAVVVPGLPPVNVHAFSFGPGRHVLDPGKGSYLVLGVVKQSAEIKKRNASLGGGRRDKRKGLDWLFESGGSTAAPKTGSGARCVRDDAGPLSHPVWADAAARDGYALGSHPDEKGRQAADRRSRRSSTRTSCQLSVSRSRWSSRSTVMPLRS